MKYTKHKIKLYSQLPDDSKLISLGYVLVLFSLFLFYFANNIEGFLVVFGGILILSVQKFVIIDFENQLVRSYYSVLFASFEIKNSNINLKDYSKVVLYQKSEIGTAQFRVKSVYHRTREYWIQISSSNGEVKLIGFLNDYKKMVDIMEMFKSKMNFEIKDLINKKLKSNRKSIKY